MARYRWRGITLKDLRNASTPDGEPTRAGDPMTTIEAAKYLKISQSHLSGVENGRDPASVKLLARLATLYDVPLKTVYEAYARTQATVVPARIRSKKKTDKIR